MLGSGNWPISSLSLALTCDLKHGSRYSSALSLLIIIMWCYLLRKWKLLKTSSLSPYLSWCTASYEPCSTFEKNKQEGTQPSMCTTVKTTCFSPLYPQRNPPFDYPHNRTSTLDLINHFWTSVNDASNPIPNSEGRKVEPSYTFFLLKEKEIWNFFFYP